MILTRYPVMVLVLAEVSQTARKQLEVLGANIVNGTIYAKQVGHKTVTYLNLFFLAFYSYSSVCVIQCVSQCRIFCITNE